MRHQTSKNTGKSIIKAVPRYFRKMFPAEHFDGAKMEGEPSIDMLENLLYSIEKTHTARVRTKNTSDKYIYMPVYSLNWLRIKKSDTTLRTESVLVTKKA